MSYGSILKKIVNTYSILSYVFLFLVYSWVIMAFAVGTVGAVVTGECSGCHTMHNSEDGSTLLTTPETYLLTNDCVGCHSSDTDQTVVNFNGDRVPIVFNTSGYPTQPLAGGNFYNVSRGGAANDVYGHNVWGISGKDSNLDIAPGDSSGCGTANSNSCHESLATNPIDTEGNGFYGRNGCTGCHQSYKHHGTDPEPGLPENAESGWYRFLSGHGWNGPGADPNYYVYGIEDDNWEQNPSAGHNRYGGHDYPGTLIPGLEDLHTITFFCRGCHKYFHGSTGTESPFVRHPSDISLPTTGEFAGYDPVANYDPVVPVAWANPIAPNTGEAVVMCLSCHRAHGSEYPDMLRWDYSEMVVGTTGSGKGKGCFVCHSQKDGL